MIPVVTMMGLQFGFLLGGSIVVEKVFNWPRAWATAGGLRRNARLPGDSGRGTVVFSGVYSYQLSGGCALRRH